jgi:hypothetical protein
MSIDDIIFARRPGEDEEAHAKRVAETERIFRNVLANADGHRLINLLINARNPFAPRFREGSTPEMAAYRDGQADVVSMLVTRGTNLAISKPDDYHNQ